MQFNSFSSKYSSQFNYFELAVHPVTAFKGIDTLLSRLCINLCEFNKGKAVIQLKYGYNWNVHWES